MPALLILNYDVSDPAALERYRTAAAPILVGEGAGELMVSTDQTVPLAESGVAGTHTVVVSFSSVEAATDIYDSHAYRALLADRLRAVSPRFAAVVPVP